MNQSRLRFMGLVFTLAFAASSLAAQPHADLSGVWKVLREYSLTGTNLMPTTDGKPIPFQPWNEALYRGAIYAEKTLHDPWPPNNQRCLVAGTIRAMKGNFPWRLIETDEQITLLFEEDGRVNIWPFRDRHQDGLRPTWYGDPIARWEGDTLVVDVVGTNGKTPWPHGIQQTTLLHVVHHLRLIEGGAKLENRISVEDPGAFTRPWESIIIFERLPRNYKLRDYRCIENNRQLPPVLPFWGSDWGPR